MKKVMTNEHPRWENFFFALERKCNFRKDKKGEYRWKCDGTLKEAKTLLKLTPEIDVIGSLKWFRDHGGYCDCEVIFNCPSPVPYQKAEAFKEKKHKEN